MSLPKEYSITIGLSPEDIKEITEGEINLFHFIPTDQTEYNDKFNVTIKQVEEDSPLSEKMDLVVDKASSVV